jgi:ribosomal protein S27AE
MTKHCKSCRRDLDESHYSDSYRTCTECRSKRKQKTNRKRLNIKECQDLAHLKDGKCLSAEYKNNSTKMKWQCSKGHEWEARMNSVKNQNQWCPHCAGNVTLNIKECQDIARLKDGKCLSTEYKTTKTKMKWQCSKGHEWEASMNSVKQGKWCPNCAGKALLTLKQCQDTAHLKDGKCLSTEYKTNKTKMKWQCSKGHEWEARMSDIKQGTWCPQCSGTAPLTLKQCQEMAEIKCGLCLSTEYKNAHTKMKWQCSKGHEWEASMNSVKQGKWCPQCSGYRSEELCRKIIEDNLLEKFPKKRPDWLHGLELDGYNEKLNIAFEYNGIQHYEYNEHFHRGDLANLETQKSRDRDKYRLCREHKVNLIIIPYQYDYRQPKELEDFILNELNRSLNIKILSSSNISS